MFLTLLDTCCKELLLLHFTLTQHYSLITWLCIGINKLTLIFCLYKCWCASLMRISFIFNLCYGHVSTLYIYSTNVSSLCICTFRTLVFLQWGRLSVFLGLCLRYEILLLIKSHKLWGSRPLQLIRILNIIRWVLHQLFHLCLLILVPFLSVRVSLYRLIIPPRYIPSYEFSSHRSISSSHGLIPTMMLLPDPLNILHHHFNFFNFFLSLPELNVFQSDSISLEGSQTSFLNTLFFF